MTLTIPWPEMHGAVTHFPVALLMGAFAFEVLATWMRRDDWRQTSFWMLAAGVLMIVPTIIAGLFTARQVFGGIAAAPEIVHIHMAAGAVASVLAVSLLLWRYSARDDFKGRAQMAVLGLALLVAGAVGFTGYLGGAMVLSAAGQAPQVAGATSGHKPQGTVRRIDPKLVARGAKLFRSAGVGCINCHTVNGQGGRVGPNLTHEGRVHPDLKWQIAHLQDPAKVHPGSMMPSFARLQPEEQKALAAYLVTRR